MFSPAPAAADPTALMASADCFEPEATAPPSEAAWSAFSRALRVLISPMFSYRAMLACLMSL